MKKTLLIFLILTGSLYAFGQSLELSLIGGYTFDSSVGIQGGEARIDGGFTGEINIGFPLAESYYIELSYLRQNTIVSASSTLFQDDFFSDAAVNYIYLGSTKRFIVLPQKLNVFGGIRSGVSIVNSTEDKFRTRTKFALGITTGVNFYITNNIGLKAGGNFNFPVVDAGANLWWSSTGGPSVGVSAWTPIVQFNPYAGIIIKLN